jgi:hypothetical protein
MSTTNTGAHEPETEPFPTVLAIALNVIAVVIASIMLLRRHPKTAMSRNVDEP